MNKMNICLFLISDGWGGAENVVYNLAKFMEKKGHNISVILNEETFPYFKDLKNVNLYNIGPVFNYEKFLKTNFGISIPSFFSEFGIISKGLKFFLVPLFKHVNYRKIRGNVLETINTINPDVVHFHNPIVLDFYTHLRKQISIPTVYTAHGFPSTKTIPSKNIMSKLSVFIRQNKTRILLNDGFNALTFVSTVTKAIHFKYGINGNNIVIPNGLDFELLKEIKYNTSLSPLVNEGNFNLLFPGGDKWWKRGDIVIKSLFSLKKNLPNIHLYLTKQVNENSHLRRLVKELELENHITFLSFLPKDEYYKLFNSIDVLVQPSEIEQMSIVLLEGMFFGKPIICPKFGGQIDFLEDKRNCLFAEINSDDVAEKILYLYKNPELRREISRNNIQDVKKFDWNNIVDQYIDLYKSIIYLGGF